MLSKAVRVQNKNVVSSLVSRSLSIVLLVLPHPPHRLTTHFYRRTEISLLARGQTLELSTESSTQSIRAQLPTGSASLTQPCN